LRLTWCELEIRDDRRELVRVERLVRLVDSLGDLLNRVTMPREQKEKNHLFRGAGRSEEIGIQADLGRRERSAVDVVELAVPRWSAMRRRGFRDQAFDADDRRAVVLLSFTSDQMRA
jgi:hypothetical protein